MAKQQHQKVPASQSKKGKAMLDAQEAEDGPNSVQVSIGIGTVIAIGAILAVIGWAINEYVYEFIREAFKNKNDETYGIFHMWVDPKHMEILP